MKRTRFNIRKLDKAIREKGLTQREISARAGIHWMTTHRILNGKTCSFGSVQKLAYAVGLDVTDLVLR